MISARRGLVSILAALALACAVLNPNGDVSRDNLKWIQELSVGLGRQTKMLPVDQVATEEFQKKMIAAIGEHRW